MPTLATYYDRFTVEINNIDAWRDGALNPPSRIRFSFFLDGGFGAGSKANQVRRKVRGPPT
jgi:hypothetical protein